VHFIDGGHGKVALMGMQILKAPNYKTNWLLHALSESWLFLAKKRNTTGEGKFSK
jgi:hypothetical protein